MTDDRKTPRGVRAFVTLDEAERDRVERDEIVLMDLHGLWWSVPMELDIHAVNLQVLTYLASAGLGKFPNLITRVARADHPAGDAHLGTVAGLAYCSEHDVLVHSPDTERPLCTHGATCELSPLLYVRRPA